MCATGGWEGGREGGREGKKEGGKDLDLDLDLGADLKAHRLPGMRHEGAPNDTENRLPMPYDALPEPSTDPPRPPRSRAGRLSHAAPRALVGALRMCGHLPPGAVSCPCPRF